MTALTNGMKHDGMAGGRADFWGVKWMIWKLIVRYAAEKPKCLTR